VGTPATAGKIKEKSLMATDNSKKPEGNEGPRLVGITGAYRGNEYFIDKDEFVIGRASDCDLMVNENTISGRHAKINKVGDHFEISDLKSTNGTYVNGVRIDRKPIRTDDKIKIDVIEFRYINPAEVSRTVIAQAPDFSAQRTMIREQETIRQAAPPPPPPAPAAPAAKPASQIEHERPQPKIQQAAFEKRGSLVGGLIVGLIIAFLFSYGGMFGASLVAAAQYGTISAVFSNIVDVFRAILAGLPFLHTHMPWLSIQWGIADVITIIMLPLALLLGGLIMQSIARKNRFGTAIVFSIFYVIIALFAQFAVLGFNFQLWTGTAPALLPAGTDQLINFLACCGYFFGVTFIISFIGALIGRK
jgi:pSer/pThr/pTyr-binding forkhead associated (FHA) protein